MVRDEVRSNAGIRIWGMCSTMAAPRAAVLHQLRGLRFIPKEKLTEAGYGDFAKLFEERAAR